MTTVTAQHSPVTRIPLLLEHPWHNPDFAELSIDAQWLLLRMRDVADTLAVVLTIPPGWAEHAGAPVARLNQACEELASAGWLTVDPDNKSYLLLSMLAGSKLLRRGPKWVNKFVGEYRRCTLPVTRARIAAVVQSLLVSADDINPSCRVLLEQMLLAEAS